MTDPVEAGTASRRPKLLRRQPGAVHHRLRCQQRGHPRQQRHVLTEREEAWALCAGLTPYALQFSLGFERVLSDTWRLNIHYEHQQGVHQYRRYEYVSGFTLPDTAPSVSVFRTDNRLRYDGIAFQVQHSFSRHFDMSAHYTLAKATTWGATVGELFDYVNGVSDVRNPFGPGDHGPSGEDVRHRFVLAGTAHLPWKIELSTLSQFESARPFTMADGADDLNGDGI